MLSSLNPFRREFGAGRTPAPKRRSPVLENRAESFPVSPDELGHESYANESERAKKGIIKKKERKEEEEEEEEN